MEARNIFIVRPINEEENDYIITIGRHLATEKHFKTRGEAEEYKSNVQWDMIVALIAEMMDVKETKVKKTEVKMTNNFQETEGKK